MARLLADDDPAAGRHASQGLPSGQQHSLILSAVPTVSAAAITQHRILRLCRTLTAYIYLTDKLGISPSRIVLAGDSTGSTIAVALLRCHLHQGGTRP